MYRPRKVHQRPAQVFIITFQTRLETQVALTSTIFVRDEQSKPFPKYVFTYMAVSSKSRLRQTSFLTNNFYQRDTVTIVIEWLTAISDYIYLKWYPSVINVLTICAAGHFPVETTFQ
jgi:hypothetical protein